MLSHSNNRTDVIENVEWGGAREAEWTDTAIGDSDGRFVELGAG
jgi:hypothetical protein